MKYFLFILFAAYNLSYSAKAQNVIFSDPLIEDGRSMDFQVLGRVGGNILIFKNLRWKYEVLVYDDSMHLKDNTLLDFLPGKTLNVDCIVYPDYFYIIYQHQKKGVLYCMAVKIDAFGKKIGEPIQLDTTHIGVMGENKIYSTINSDNKKSIFIFKIQRKNDKANFATKLFDSSLTLLDSSRIQIPFEDNKEEFGNFYIDNKSNWVFTNAVSKTPRQGTSSLYLYVKGFGVDSFNIHKAPATDIYLNEISLKVDNVNERYIANSLYYTEETNNTQGLYTYIWDNKNDSNFASITTIFNDEVRGIAKSSGSSKAAFDDYYIHNVILKRDGSFILSAENISSQSSGMNTWNRYGGGYSPFFNSYDYYMYQPYYYDAYRPFNNFNNTQSIRYYYDNVLVLNMSNTGIAQWSNFVQKQQADDDNDNYLSFKTLTLGSEIHFLYNDISKKDNLLSDNIISTDGSSRRSPTVRTYERGYSFMPRYAKQIASKQLIIPSTYRGQICFAKVTL